jgi:hypothetical protein
LAQQRRELLLTTPRFLQFHHNYLERLEGQVNG